MLSTEKYYRDLYNLLKVKGYKPVALDYNRDKVNPEEAVAIEFSFKKDGKEYGVAYITIDKSVTLYYENDVEDSPSGPTKGLDYDDTWSGLQQHLKQWSMDKQLKWELKNKDQLGDDLAQRKYMQDKENINEGYYPMGKQASYSDAIPTVKIILQHTRQIQEGEQRYRNVAKIFLENQLGERILAPTTRPGIAQVYARHLAEGGVPNDERWNHIKGLCEEYSKMAGFVRAVKNHQFNESAQQLVNEGVNHYTSLRETLSRMRGQRGYNTYFESWTPTLMEDESEDNTINELFVQETLDPRIESVLPILSKLSKSVVEMKEVDELAEWADNLTEAPGAMTLKHNQNTEKSNLKAFDLEEDNVQDELKAAELARQKMKLPPTKRGPLSLGDIERSQQHPSSSGVVGRLADEPEKKLDEEDVEESGLQAYLGNKKYGKAGMDALRKAGRDGASKEKMAKIRAKYDKLDEEGVEEGAQKKPNATTRHLRDYPVSDKEVAKPVNKPVNKPEKKKPEQGVAEGSEQTNESLDRLLYLANIETSKKVDESIKSIDKSIDKMFSLGGELPSDDKIDKVDGQDMSFDEEIRANTINHLLLKNPSLSQDELKDKSTAELISMLREGVAEGEFAGHYQTGPEGQWRNKGPKANKPAKVGDLVGASESFINTDPQSVVTEMDKSQPSSDRGGESSGDPYAKGGKATPVKAKNAAKDAKNVLNRAMDNAHKKDVKEGQEDLDAILRIIRK